MYKPIEQNELALVALVTICLIGISPYLAIIALFTYAIFRLRLF